MDVIKHLTLLLSGLCLLSSCLAQHPFVFFNTPKTWYEAQSYCIEVGGDLATIDDMEDMQTALRLTDNRYDDGVWIGLHKSESHAWHWSLPDKDLYQEGERTYVNVSETTSNCALYRPGALKSEHCGRQIHSVCFDASQQGQHRYVLSPVLNGWIAARDYCRTHHTDLASVRNPAEEQFIQNLTLGLDVYLGYFRDPWEWADGTYSSMRYWKPAQHVYSLAGVESCVSMLKSQSGKWGERSCGDALPFLCKRPIKRFISKVQISSKEPGLDLNDPAVQADLLKLVRKQLNPIAVTIYQQRWRKHPDGNVFVKMR